MANDNQDFDMAVEVADEPKKRKEKKPIEYDEYGNPLPSRKRGLFKVLFIVVPILLCAGFVFGLIYLNWFGARNMFIDSVNRLDPEYAEARREYYMELERIDLYWEEFWEMYHEEEYNLSAWRRDLEARAEYLDDREDWLNREELRLLDWEARRTPIHRRDPTSPEHEEMWIVGGIYAAMTPQQAAERLVALYTREDAAAILMFMSQRNAGAILAQIPPPYAARITEILLTN